MTETAETVELVAAGGPWAAAGGDLARTLQHGAVLLDGGLASQLTATGSDLTDYLWSARVLVDDPGAIVEAHLEFLRAGARVITTASYQATRAGFARRGIDAAGTEALLRRSVALADEARERAYDEGIPGPVWIAASVGPYGAMLADGSEYRGAYGLSVDQLVDFHAPRLAVLANAGADVLACETVPDTIEGEALMRALAGLGTPAWLSYTVGGPRTRAGQPLDEAFGVAVGVKEIVAVGVNCCAPADVATAVAVATAVTGLPGVAYPNSGERWDAVRRDWTGEVSLDPTRVQEWVDAGARLIGGCCRVTAGHLRAIHAALGGA
ncbi:homocysteine S-methyltransferase [Luedemannella helvata]|uniref:Homocysteine S-methyltransferase n=1 Tax=Luedemannella helvata TaxID=349315 RepID=A0ABP4WSW9_9ACTN